MTQTAMTHQVLAQRTGSQPLTVSIAVLQHLRLTEQ